MDLQPDLNEDEDNLPDEVEEIARVKPEGFFDHGEIDLEDLFDHLEINPEDLFYESYKVDMSSLAGVEEHSTEPVLESYDMKAAQLVDGCLVCKKCKTKNPLMVNKCSGCGVRFRR